jgi:tetraacyldisaccharide 4'-kinase
MAAVSRMLSVVAPPVLRVASAIYARAAAEQRARGARRRLRRPVISVGNLSVGGTGKTPLVAAIAQVLRDAGERPSVLTRGYGREEAPDGVVVVSDGTRVRADLARSGDEPLWLARTLPGVAVLACANRHLAGALAESRLGCTVHVLDDGFQHHALGRDADVVVVAAADLADRVVPAGRLRETPDVLRQADAIVTPGEDPLIPDRLTAMGVAATLFHMTRTLGVPRSVEPWGAPPRVPRSAPVMAVAGIARPERFFDALSADGWHVVSRRAFADHHRFTHADVEAIAAAARAAGATLVLTTEKDLMRLLPLRPLPMATAWVPLQVKIAPEDDFAAWLCGRLTRAGTARVSATTVPAIPGA